jgi:uncharacterized RDD family membrane protein YckC
MKVLAVAEPRVSQGELGTERDVIGHRILAALIDTGVWMAAILFISIAASRIGEDAGLIVGIVGTLLVVFLYSFILEGWTGQTLGKLLLGIVVVKADGRPCGFMSSFVRNAFRIVDFQFYYLVALLVVLLTSKRQRIGDVLANTIVVRKRRTID